MAGHETPAEIGPLGLPVIAQGDPWWQWFRGQLTTFMQRTPSGVMTMLVHSRQVAYQVWQELTEDEQRHVILQWTERYQLDRQSDDRSQLRQL